MKKKSQKLSEKPCCEAGISWRKIAIGLFIMLIFVIGWYFLSGLDLPFTNWLESLQEDKTRGLLVYFVLTLVAIVAAPLATVPLMPLAASFWGWQSVFVVSVVAWQIGAVIDFYLARRFGRRILQYFTDLQKIDKLVDNLPNTHHFFSIFILRMLFPVDILSYVLGFIQVDFWIYFWATLLGVIPFAFLLSYGGEFATSWQIVPVILVGILVFLFAKKILKKQKDR